MPTVNFPLSVEDLSPRVQALRLRVRDFIKEHIIPIEKEVIAYHDNPETMWTTSPQIQQLRAKAKREGLWNLFLPVDISNDKYYGAGLTNVEYAYISEEMGKSPLASEVFNCAPPDSGNIEVLIRYGTDEQKKKWLMPLIEGQITSCFGMTEPAVASSDANNIESSIRRDGNYYVINGTKWWSSGACNKNCKVCIFMGKTDPNAPRHKQQSMIIVPMDTPGVTIVRPVRCFGSDEPPRGHAEVRYENVRVPASNILLGEGRGFEIAQGRLGPARVHHCMRLIGYGERSMEIMLERIHKRTTFGKKLVDRSTIQADVAQSRIDLEQCRLFVLKTAHMIDTKGSKAAAVDVAMIKVAVPNMCSTVIDRAIQACGALGVSADVPLTYFFVRARTMRIADGPDEVHRQQIAKRELLNYRQQAKL